MIRLAAVYAFLFCLLFASCDDGQKKRTVLSKEKMEAVLWDVLQADAFTGNFIKKDSTKNEAVENAALQKKIFELHKVTREDFMYSYDYYTAQPEIMKILLDSMSAKAERDRNKLMQERYGGMKTAVQ